MARYVKISILGPAPYQRHYDDNLDALVEEMRLHWEAQLENVLCDKPDLILLPEACDRYPNFSMEERFRYYEARGNRIRDYFRQVCLKNHCCMGYSAARQMPDKSYRNSTQLIGRDGEIIGIYNKNHLVIGEVTEGRMLCGRDAPLFSMDFGKTACAICFDLNFDELLKKYEAQKPELILFSSMYHGGMVQNEWAFRCRSYFAGAIAGLPCTIVNPLGEIVAHSTNYRHFLTADINLDYVLVHLDENWKKLHAVKQKYGAQVKINDPGYLGAVMISSETDRFSANDLVEEFQFERLDDYFSRSLNCRREHTENLD